MRWNCARRLDRSALLRLLLLLILKLLAALLHFLQKLLRSAALTWRGNNAWTAHCRFGLVHWLGFFDGFIIAGLIPVGPRLVCHDVGLGGEHQFPGRSFALIANHQDVVA